MAEKILVIDDEQSTVQLLAIILEQHGFEVIKALRAEDGLKKAYRTQPDLVLLDVSMPDMDGFEVCRRLRQMSDMPIVFLTALGNKEAAMQGFDLGADDYIVKPPDADLLVRKIQSILRRIPPATLAEELTFNGGDFRINFYNREVRVRSNQIHLTPKEFNLLGVLARNSGRVVARGELIREAWGTDYTQSIDSLKLYIHYLRHKVERDPDNPEYILTSRGVGYRFAGRTA